MWYISLREIFQTAFEIRRQIIEEYSIQVFQSLFRSFQSCSGSLLVKTFQTTVTYSKSVQLAKYCISIASYRFWNLISTHLHSTNTVHICHDQPYWLQVHTMVILECSYLAQLNTFYLLLSAADLRQWSTAVKRQRTLYTLVPITGHLLFSVSPNTVDYRYFLV